MSKSSLVPPSVERAAPRALPWTGAKAYLLAVFLVGAGFAIRLALDPLWGDRLPYGSFFVAELIAVQFVGARPFLLVMVAGFLLSDWFFVAPRGSLLIADRINQVNAVGYFVLSFVLLYFAERMRRALDQERAARSELKLNLDELRESEARYSALIDNTMDAILLTDNEGRILAANREACRMFGRTEEELRHTSGLALVDPADLQRTQAAIAARRREGKVRLEIKFLRPDGTQFTGEVSSSVFKARDGAAMNSSIIRDVSDRKLAEQELARLAAIVESSDDAIIGKALDGTIVNWNSGAERLYGYSAAQAVGKNISMLMPRDLVDELGPLLERVRRGERISHFESRRQTQDGRVVFVSLSISPVRDSSGSIVGAATIARDISERKRAEQERERLVRELQTALANVKTLSGLLPICASCKKIRDDRGYWNQIEIYIRERSDAEFTHGICPDCARRLYPETFLDPK